MRDKEANLLNSGGIKMVICDMAGTTVDEQNLVYKILQRAINHEGFDFSLDEVLLIGAGQEKKQAIRSILSHKFGEFQEEQVLRMYENFRRMLVEAYEIEEIKPQANALDFFDVLHRQGIIVVLNTGYDRKTAESILVKLGWEIGVQIDGLVTADEVQHNRPYPDMILYAMNLFGIASGVEVVKIGDSVIDVEEGKNAGCQLSIGITTGAHSRERLEKANADKIVDNLMEIPVLLS